MPLEIVVSDTSDSDTSDDQKDINRGIRSYGSSLSLPTECGHIHTCTSDDSNSGDGLRGEREVSRKDFRMSAESVNRQESEPIGQYTERSITLFVPT